MGKPSKRERVAIIPDIHCPYHDPRAVNLAASIVNDFQPDRVIFLGDFVDCTWASSFKNNQATIPGELESEKVLA